MKHLNKYEDSDLENLMDDLRDLGMGEYKVYLSIRKSMPIIGKYTEELLDFVKIHFPILHKSKGKVEYEEILLSIMNRDYIIEVYPNEIATSGSFSDEAIIRTMEHNIGNTLIRDKDIRNFVENDEFSYDSIFNRNKLVLFIQNLANKFSVATEIDLIIDGVVKESIAKN